MTQLRELALPFSGDYVHSNPSGGGSYVKHHVIVQRLLSVVGPYSYRVREVLRGDVGAIEPNPKGNSERARKGKAAMQNVVVGVIAALECEIDGRQVVIEEVGDCEDPHNWPHDGARMKDAMSDAIKRCAARIGLGLHLWAQNEYFLPAQLAEIERREAEAAEHPTTEVRNGAGELVGVRDSITDEAAYTDDDPERPF